MKLVTRTYCYDHPKSRAIAGTGMCGICFQHAAKNGAFIGVADPHHPTTRTDHCEAGHEYTPETTYYRPNGNRECRICRNTRYQNSKNGDTPDTQQIITQCKQLRTTGWTTKEIGELIGIHPDTISKWCRGTQKPGAAAGKAHTINTTLKHALETTR